MSRAFPLEKIRNIGIIAHIDAGKTTTTERILYRTGRTYKIGNVDEGTAAMDWMDQEKERGITITAAATTCYWRDHCINIIDTPGHVDFTVEVERSLRVLDGGVVIFDGVAGVEAQSETVWRQADRYKVARICFVNKIDRAGANLDYTVSTINKRLQANALLIQIPLGSESTFEGLIDLVENKALVFSDDPNMEPIEKPIPDNILDTAAGYRQTLIETLAENDDDIMRMYLEGQEIPVFELKAAIRKLTVSNKIVPVLCGSALRGKGIRPLIDAIVDYLPSPLDISAIRARKIKGEREVLFKPSDDEPFSALAFKTVSDPFMGRLTYMRVYSGRIHAGAQVLNSTIGEKERLGKLYIMHANYRKEVDYADTGCIIAALGLKKTSTGDSLCEASHPVLFERIRFAEPVLSMSIEPKSKADQDKLDDTLNKLTAEDPTLKVYYDQETGQNIICGMGELHLEVVVERMLREYGVRVNVGRPQVAYKETITIWVESEGRFIRQSGGKGQYGHVRLKLEPNERGKGFEFSEQIRGGAIPKEFVPAVEAGTKSALQSGVLAGYPTVDIKVTLYDGSYHEVDSSDLAFRMAASLAIKDGLRKAKSILLEPIMEMEVVTPTEFLGDIMGNLNSRRARIAHTESHEDFFTVRCFIPLAETFGFTSDLRSLSQGRASHTMHFHNYEELPVNVSEQIITKLERGK
jgi:elongation factor G